MFVVFVLLRTVNEQRMIARLLTYIFLPIPHQILNVKLICNNSTFRDGSHKQDTPIVRFFIGTLNMFKPTAASFLVDKIYIWDDFKCALHKRTERGSVVAEVSKPSNETAINTSALKRVS